METPNTMMGLFSEVDMFMSYSHKKCETTRQAQHPILHYLLILHLILLLESLPRPSLQNRSRMPRVSGVDAAARKKHPREFSLLQQLGGESVDAEVGAACDARSWICCSSCCSPPTVSSPQAVLKAASTYGDESKAKSLVGSGGACCCMELCRESLPGSCSTAA